MNKYDYNPARPSGAEVLMLVGVSLLLISAVIDIFSNGANSNNVLTDNGTGCQYLQSKGGGLTPRLDADGHHICQEPEQ